MTYSITRASGLAPDAEPVLKRLYPLFRGTILRWTITQSLDTLQQLLIGIRYLPSDLLLNCVIVYVLMIRWFLFHNQLIFIVYVI